MTNEITLEDYEGVYFPSVDAKLLKKVAGHSVEEIVTTLLDKGKKPAVKHVDLPLQWKEYERTGEYPIPKNLLELVDGSFRINVLSWGVSNRWKRMLDELENNGAQIGPRFGKYASDSLINMFFNPKNPNAGAIIEAFYELTDELDIKSLHGKYRFDNGRLVESTVIRPYSHGDEESVQRILGVDIHDLL